MLPDTTLPYSAENNNLRVLHECAAPFDVHSSAMPRPGQQGQPVLQSLRLALGLKKCSIQKMPIMSSWMLVG
jgi:hypothetical protein